MTTLPALVRQEDTPEALFDCLQKRLPYAAAYLRSLGFPPPIVHDAVEQAEEAALVAITTGVAGRMSSPQRKKWLRVTAYNAACTLASRNREFNIIDDCPDRCLLQECRPDILALLDRLTEELRIIIEGVVLDGLSFRELASRIRVPRYDLKRRYRVAIAILRREMDDLLY